MSAPTCCYMVLAYITCTVITTGLAQSVSWPPRRATNKQFYVETSFMVNWFGAYASCMMNNSRLARVESDQENSRVLQLILNTGIKKHSYWIGGSDLANEGRWTWLLSGQPVAGYTFWLDGEPNNEYDAEDCLNYYAKPEASMDYKWNDSFCTKQNYFICEYYDRRPGIDDDDWRSGGAGKISRFE